MRNKMNYPYKFVTKNHMQLGTLTTDVEKEKKKLEILLLLTTCFGVWIAPPVRQ